MELLDRFSAPLHVCTDPACPYAHLPPAAHHDRHNPPCAELTIGDDGTEVICELPADHAGPHRGTVHR